MSNQFREVHIVIARNDGGASVTSIVEMTPLKSLEPEGAKRTGWIEQDGVWYREVTDTVIESELARTVWLEGVSLKDVTVLWHRIDPNDIPVDRHFRNAWSYDGSSLTVDMPKAREIHRNNLRSLRSPLFNSLDADYMRADEDGNNTKKRNVADRKKQLRDITEHPSIEAAQTPEELKVAALELLSD